MGLPAFDILKFVEELKESGMPEKQVKLIAEGFNTIQQLRPVTIEDVRHEIQSLEEKIDLKFTALEEKVDLKFDMVDERFHSIHNSLLLKLGGIVVVCTGILGTLLGLILHHLN